MYQLLINEQEQTGLNYLKHPKALIEHSNDLNDALTDINDYNTN